MSGGQSCMGFQKMFGLYGLKHQIGILSVSERQF